jgi:hypothetical protein
MLDRVYVGLSIPVPSSTAMTAASYAIPDEHRDAVLGHESQQPGD